MEASFRSLGNISLVNHGFSMSVNIGAHVSTLSLSRPMLTPVEDFLLANLQPSVDTSSNVKRLNTKVSFAIFWLIATIQ